MIEDDEQGGMLQARGRCSAGGGVLVASCRIKIRQAQSLREWDRRGSICGIKKGGGSFATLIFGILSRFPDGRQFHP